MSDNIMNSQGIALDALLCRAQPSLTDWQLLSCGPLSLRFDARQGALRHICLGQHEVVRAVYVAVRDRDWNTLPPCLSNLDLQSSESYFQLTFDVVCRAGDIDFFWRGLITGEAAGTLTFRMEGTARSTFLRNRIGFCVLHPPKECVAQPCRILKTDGSSEQGTFPDRIAPHQPFTDMRAITHKVQPGWEATVRFEGDVFEMEDQRNWTDASFKTYCTPLNLPFPVAVLAGTQIAQTVRIDVTQSREEAGRDIEMSRSVRVAMEGKREGKEPSFLPLPPIGLGVASHRLPLTMQEQARLRALRLSHLRVDLDMASTAWPDTLRMATAQARTLNLGLEVALILTEAAEAQLNALAALLLALRPPVTTWLIFPAREKATSAAWVELARTNLQPYTPDARIGGGTNAYFAELNRNRPPLGELDVVCYSVNPQVHAFDNVTLAENLQAQAETVRSARDFCGNLPLLVSPVTLRPRFNPDATGDTAEPTSNQLPAAVDARQMSLFGAAWTLGSLKALCEAGADSLTFYETTGWRGLMEAQTGSPLPAAFPSLPGAVFPMYHVFADFADFAGGCIVPCISDAPLSVVCVLLQHGERRCLLCANLTSTPQSVRLSMQKDSKHVRLRLLEAANAEQALRYPESFHKHEHLELNARIELNADGSLNAPKGTITLPLPPYAYARLDED